MKSKKACKLQAFCLNLARPVGWRWALVVPANRPDRKAIDERGAHHSAAHAAR